MNRELFNTSTKAKNSLEDILIEPIMIVCNMFLDQLTDIEYKYSPKELPERIVNLRKNMSNLINSYEEGKRNDRTNRNQRG